MSVIIVENILALITLCVAAVFFGLSLASNVKERTKFIIRETLCVVIIALNILEIIVSLVRGNGIWRDVVVFAVIWLVIAYLVFKNRDKKDENDGDDDEDDEADGDDGDDNEDDEANDDDDNTDEESDE